MEWEGAERNALDDGMPEEVVRAYKKAKESLKSVKTYAVMVSDKKGRMLKILNGESGELIRLHIASLQGLLEKNECQWGHHAVLVRCDSPHLGCRGKGREKGRRERP